MWCVVNATPRSFTPRGNTRYPAGWAPGQVWTRAENLAPYWDSTPRQVAIPTKLSPSFKSDRGEINRTLETSEKCVYLSRITECFPTAGPRLDTGTWHQLYRAARGFPGICHFSFLIIFHE